MFAVAWLEFSELSSPVTTCTVTSRWGNGVAVTVNSAASPSSTVTVLPGAAAFPSPMVRTDTGRSSSVMVRLASATVSPAAAP